jgi:septal ring factor EnvC (AmiA/AmiB activator)
MASYSSNNSSLAATIDNLKQLIAEAQADMASSKKGGSQFTAIIKQYNDQITQLEDQQKQQMAQLTQSLTTLGAASPYQDMLQSIQSILNQYEQFAGAAQNATQLAQANQFLTSSLQQLGTTYQQQLLQDETTAVQDALSLNDLYTQRNQLQLQFLQQTEAIEGQGTLTRGITQSQSKFSQLYSLDVGHQNQLQDLNAQISTEQYKVSAEQQIFNLATTRQGLESQLVTLQEQGIDYDMARIAAMQNLLGVLQSTGYSITNLGSISNSDPNAAITQLIQILVGLLGNGSTASSIAGSNGASLLSLLLGLSSTNSTGLGSKG